MEFASGDSSPFSSENSRVRRMISNRESARRSRLRKQRHVEDLRNRAGQLRIENRALADRIFAVAEVNLALRHQNELLRRESAALHRRLSDIRRFIFLRQLHRFSSQLSAAVDPPFS